MIYCARIVAERVAVAPDYARLLTRLWGPMNYGAYGESAFLARSSPAKMTAAMPAARELAFGGAGRTW